MDHLDRDATPRRRLVATVVGIAAGAVAGSTCLALAAAGDDRGALVLASVSVGSFGVLGGAATLVLGRDRGVLPRFRLAGGCASLLYGVGTLVDAAQGRAGARELFSIGDLLTLLALPLALVMMITLPRPRGAAARPARLMADAAVVATAGAVLLWQLVLEASVAGFGATVAGALLVLALELFCFGYFLGLAVLGHDRWTVLLVLGVGSLVASNIVKLDSSLSGDEASVWMAPVIMCLGAPLLLTGVLLMSARPTSMPSASHRGAEARSALSTVLILSVAAAAVVLASFGRVSDEVNRGLIGMLVITVLVREVVLQRQRMRDLQALRHLAEHDALTGAGNRRALNRALATARGGPEEPYAVVVLDLDGFKDVNDRYGPSVGDAMLGAVARALGRVDPGRAEVFRLGADDFAVLAPAQPHRVEALARRACDAVTGAGRHLPGVERLALGAHAGVASVGVGPGDDWLPVSRATQALVAAQRSTGTRVRVWGEELALAQRRRSQLEDRLRLALAERSLEIYLQPVVTLASGRLEGFEALSRWDDAVLGAVFPDEFVPVAEETGLVVDLGAAVLDAALAALVRCDGLTRGLTMAVNASPVELRRAGYVDAVAAALAAHGVPADLLVVEVTEAVMVTPGGPAVVALQGLADMGVRVAVDDFGTGYSSLAYLTSLPVHILKIDRSLTASLGDRAPSAVVQAAAAMAAGMGLAVIAEGVEEASQLVALAAMGIGAAQGWLYARALPPVEALELVARGLALGPSAEQAALGAVTEPVTGSVVSTSAGPAAGAGADPAPREVGMR